MTQDKNIIFVHLPKAGGTTLHKIIERQYWDLREQTYTVKRFKDLPSFLHLPQEEKDKIKLLKGHIPYGLHKHLKGESVYFTMLREPVKRIISAYYYITTTPTHDRFDHIKNKHIDFSTFVEEDVNPWLWNAQTKLLAGITQLEEECTEEIYHKALMNINQHFAAVGFLESFEESLLQFKQALQWGKIPFYKKENVTQYKKQNIELSEAIKQKVVTKNQYDIRLYQELKNKYLKQTSLNSIWKNFFFKLANYSYQQIK